MSPCALRARWVPGHALPRSQNQPEPPDTHAEQVSLTSNDHVSRRRPGISSPSRLCFDHSEVNFSFRHNIPTINTLHFVSLKPSFPVASRPFLRSLHARLVPCASPSWGPLHVIFSLSRRFLLHLGFLRHELDCVVPPVFDFCVFRFSYPVSFLRACSCKESLTPRHTPLSVKNNREENTMGVFPFFVTCNLVSAAQWKPRFPSPSPPALWKAAPWLQDRTSSLAGAVSCLWSASWGVARPCSWVLGDRYAQGETRPVNPCPSVTGHSRDASGADDPSKSAPSRSTQAT